MIKAVIFDMDGVLVDSVSCNAESFRILLKEYEVDYNKGQHTKYIGRSLSDQIALWEKDYKIKREIDVKEFAIKAFEIQKNLLKNCKTNIYLLKLLKNLRSGKILMGVGTSSAKHRAETILSSLKLDRYFSCLITADDVSLHKPSPEIFLAVAKKLGVKPEECVVIEDASDGVQAAKNGNMKVVALVNKYQTKEQLSRADLVINSFKDLSLDKILKL